LTPPNRDPRQTARPAGWPADIAAHRPAPTPRWLPNPPRTPNLAVMRAWARSRAVRASQTDEASGERRWTGAGEGRASGLLRTRPSRLAPCWAPMAWSRPLWPAGPCRAPTPIVCRP